MNKTLGMILSICALISYAFAVDLFYRRESDALAADLRQDVRWECNSIRTRLEIIAIRLDFLNAIPDPSLRDHRERASLEKEEEVLLNRLRDLGC